MIRRLSLFVISVLFFIGLACAPEPLEPLPVGPTDGWKVLRPLPGGYNLYDIWGQHPSNVWAVGSNGTIVHWDGDTVRRAQSPTHYRLEALDGWASDNIYAAGSSDLIHYDGRVWELADQFLTEFIKDIYCAEDGRLYLVGTMGLVYRDETGWHTIDGPRGYSDNMWLGSDGLIRVCDNSLLWVVENDVAVVEQDFAPSTIMFGDGDYLVTDDPGNVDSVYFFIGGGTWEPTNETAYSVRSVLDKGSVVYANNSGIKHSTGYEWHNSSGRWIYKLAHCGPWGLLACGHGGTLLHAEIGHDEVVYDEASDEIGFRAINVFDGNSCDNIWAGEWWGRVLHFDGETWTNEHSGLSYNHAVTRIQVLDDGWVFAAGGSGLARRNPEDGFWSVLPEHPGDIGRFHAFSPDSVLATSYDDFRLWNGDAWLDMGSTGYSIYALSATPSGQLYALVSSSTSSSLLIWDGADFVDEWELPGFSGRLLHASRESETLWIAGRDNDDFHNTVVYRYEQGELQKVSSDYQLPGSLIAMTELKSDDLFLLGADQLWRFHGGNWTHENGLPEMELYQTVWSHPDCGVFVQGHPTFFKNFAQE